jgi:hypothetical protein
MANDRFRTRHKEAAMAAQDTAIEGNSDPASVACTLTSADLATQSDRWKQRAARALIERVETAHGLRISFRPESGVEEELGKLAAVENECCSWADWTVEIHADRVVLDVRSSGQGIDTLHGMFTSL